MPVFITLNSMSAYEALMRYVWKTKDEGKALLDQYITSRHRAVEASLGPKELRFMVHLEQSISQSD